MNELKVSRTVHLDVYIAAHCWQCPAARALAKAIARQFPALDVRIIDLDQPNAQRPASVFAVPTFVLNGKTIYLGNPYYEELAQKVTRALHSQERRSGEPHQDWLPAPE